MTEISVKNIQDIDYASFFYGMSKAAYIYYIANPPGMNLSPLTALMKWRKNTDKLFNKLHSEILVNLSQTDSMELQMELDLSEGVEFFTHEFFIITGLFNEGGELTSVAERKYPFRPIEEETYLMYFIGLSWWMEGTTKNREKKIMDFLKEVRAKLAPNVTNERLYELWTLSISVDKLQDYREVFFHIMECTKAIDPRNNLI